MHVLSIGGTEYKAIETWEEMPLSTAIQVHQVIDDMPSMLRELYDHSTKKDPDQKLTDELYAKITDEDMIKLFPLFYGEIMCTLSTIPRSVMEGMMYDWRTSGYKKYCEGLVMGIMFGDYSEIKNIKSFEWESDTYYLPTSGHFLGGNVDLTKVSDQDISTDVPMQNEQTIVFVEIADLEIYSERLKGGKYEVAANIVSIMCRPEGEEYNEKKSLERAEKFKELPMSIVWEVFFCIQQLLTISSQNTQISQLRKVVDRQRKLRLQALKHSDGTPRSSKSQKQGFLTKV